MRKLILSVIASPLLLISCNNKTEPVTYSIDSLDLKRGEVVSCGPQDGEAFGTVSFSASVPEKFRNDFNIGVALLHSFEYDEAEKMFAKVIDGAPNSAMAYWGVAMSNFHPLWAPPAAAELEKGRKAIEIARSIKDRSKRESDYIEAIAQFYTDAGQLDHKTRVLKFEKAMEAIFNNYPDDKEATVFYALALNAAADPTDKTYIRQRKAFGLLDQLFEKDPLHPGIAHYIIHNYDNPELATMALPAARKYAGIAPGSAHAQHMPSHIFTRLGLWDEAIQSNIASVNSAKCYAEKAGINGHWDEELHGLDYLMYAYLQKKDDQHAKEQLDYLYTITKVEPMTFKVAYAYAAIPARYALERKDWKQAASLQLFPADLPWNKFPWQEAITHFAKLMGNVHTKNMPEAQTELNKLKVLHDTLSKQKNKAMEAAQVMVQIQSGEAWIQFKNGNNEKALELMHAAADTEDGMEKHPVTPGAVIPARELLGEMLLAMNRPAEASEAFEANLKLHPNRRNGLAGAALASQSAKAD